MNTGFGSRCPKCGSENIASIIWDGPVYYDGLIQDIDEGHVHIGGCCITVDDPEWCCNDCEEGFSYWDNLSQCFFRHLK